MNLKEIVYVSMLSAILATPGCAGALPDLKNPEVRKQLEGTYKGVLQGNKVSYKIGKEGCVALVEFEDHQLSHIIDKGCDNAAEFMNFQNRKYLLESGKAEDVDKILEIIQKELIKPENKVE